MIYFGQFHFDMFYGNYVYLCNYFPVLKNNLIIFLKFVYINDLHII